MRPHPYMRPRGGLGCLVNLDLGIQHEAPAWAILLLLVLGRYLSLPEARIGFTCQGQDV